MQVGMVGAFRAAGYAQSAGAQAFARGEEVCHAAYQRVRRHNLTLNLVPCISWSD